MEAFAADLRLLLRLPKLCLEAARRPGVVARVEQDLHALLRRGAQQLTGRSTVILELGNGQGPARIRHGWADSPILNLYDEAGLPAGPFELELE